MDDAKVRKE